jgi:hypothetical protein
MLVPTLMVLVIVFAFISLFQALALDRREKVIDKLIEENAVLSNRLRNIAYQIDYDELEE